MDLTLGSADCNFQSKVPTALIKQPVFRVGTAHWGRHTRQALALRQKMGEGLPGSLFSCWSHFPAPQSDFNKDTSPQDSGFLSEMEELWHKFLTRPGCPQFSTRSTSMTHYGERAQRGPTWAHPLHPTTQPTPQSPGPARGPGTQQPAGVARGDVCSGHSCCF